MFAVALLSDGMALAMSAMMAALFAGSCSVGTIFMIIVIRRFAGRSTALAGSARGCYIWRMRNNLQCIAVGHGDRWEAFCPDLDLAVQGRSLEEVRRSLDKAVHLHI